MATIGKRTLRLSEAFAAKTRDFVRDERARGGAETPEDNARIVQNVMAAYAMAIGGLLAVKGNYRADTGDDIQAFGRMLSLAIRSWREQHRDAEQQERRPAATPSETVQ